MASVMGGPENFSTRRLLNGGYSRIFQPEAKTYWPPKRETQKSHSRGSKLEEKKKKKKDGAGQTYMNSERNNLSTRENFKRACGKILRIQTVDERGQWEEA